MNDAELIQRTDEWKAARLGSLGASAVHEVAARTKTGYSSSRANRLAALAIERLTGQSQDTYQNAAMLAGIEMEPEARNAYAFVRDADVVEVGLIRHPEIKGTHASPDGLVGDDGLVEIKCPQPAAHLDVLLTDAIPDKYIVQMQWQMACSGRKWCDFVSYNRTFPQNLRLWVKRIARDDKRIVELEAIVMGFLAELDAKVAQLEKIAA